MANKYLDDFRQEYPMYKDMDDTTLAKNIHKTFYSDMSENDYMAKLGLPVSDEESWSNKIAPLFGKTSPADIAETLEPIQSEEEYKVIPQQKIDVPTLEEQNSNIIDQVQSSLLQQSRESARAVSKFAKRGAESLNATSLANAITVPESISQEEADVIVGYSKENRAKDKESMQSIRDDWDKGNYGSAVLGAVKELPAVLADSSGEIVQLLNLPSTAVAISARVSKYEDEYIKNNNGKKPDATWYAEAIATQSTLLLAERFGIKVLGKTALSKVPKDKLTLTGGLVSAGAFEAGQEYGEGVSEEHLTQKDGAKTIGEIAQNPDHKFGAFIGGITGTALKGGAETISSIRKEPETKDEILANALQEEVNKFDLVDTTPLPTGGNNIGTVPNDAQVIYPEPTLQENIKAGFEKLQEDINSNKPIEEQIHEELEVKTNEENIIPDNNTSTNKTAQVQSEQVSIQEPISATNSNTVNEGENEEVSQTSIDETQWNDISNEIEKGTPRSRYIEDKNKDINDPYIYKEDEIQTEQGYMPTVVRKLATKEELNQKKKNSLVKTKWQSYFDEASINEDGYMKTKAIPKEDFKAFNDYLKDNNIGKYERRKGFKIESQDVLDTWFNKDLNKSDERGTKDIAQESGGVDMEVQAEEQKEEVNTTPIDNSSSYKEYDNLNEKEKQKVWEDIFKNDEFNNKKEVIKINIKTPTNSMSEYQLNRLDEYYNNTDKKKEVKFNYLRTTSTLDKIPTKTKQKGIMVDLPYGLKGAYIERDKSYEVYELQSGHLIAHGTKINSDLKKVLETANKSILSKSEDEIKNIIKNAPTLNPEFKIEDKQNNDIINEDKKGLEDDTVKPTDLERNSQNTEDKSTSIKNNNESRANEDVGDTRQDRNIDDAEDGTTKQSSDSISASDATTRGTRSDNEVSTGNKSTGTKESSSGSIDSTRGNDVDATGTQTEQSEQPTTAESSKRPREEEANSQSLERAGTSVASRIVILDKGQTNSEYNREMDLSNIDDIQELFERIKDISFVDKVRDDAKEDNTTSYMSSEKKLTKKEVEEVLEKGREQFEQRPYSIEEWDKLFPNNKIDTPIGVVKLGEKQFEKLDPNIPDPKNPKRKKQDRREHLDYIYKTLKNPSMIIKENGKHIFVKEFIKQDESTRKYTSIILKIDDLDINVSNYNMNIKQIMNEIKKADEVILPEEVTANMVANPHPTSSSADNGSISKKSDNSQDDISFSRNSNNTMPNNPDRLTGSKRVRPESGTITLRDKEIKLNDKWNPTTPASIRKLVVTTIGNRLYFSQIRQKADGFYKKVTGETRIKDINNVEVYAHEMAHYLDFYNGNKVFNNAYHKREFKDEIKSFSYTKQKEHIFKEGFAEYVRAWLTQYNFAKEKAPNFTDEFETILKTNPKLEKQMNEIQEQMHKWYNQGDEAMFSALIGDKKTRLDSLKETVFNIKHNLANKTLVNIFDRTHGFSVAEFHMFGKLNKGEQSATKLLRIALGGSASTYEAVVKWGTPKLTAKGDIEFSGKGLADIFGPALNDKTKPKGEEFKELMEYFAAVQAKEMKTQNKKTPFSDSMIDTILERTETKQPYFKDIFKEYQEFNDRMLDFYVDMNYLRPSDVENFKAKNQVYVPMQRVVESMGQKDGKVSSGFMSRKGSDRNIRDIEANITEQLYYHIRGAMIANAKNKLFTQLNNHEDGSLFAARLPSSTKRVQVHIEQQAEKMVQYLYDAGLMVDEFGDIVEIEDNVTYEEVLDNTIDTLITKPQLMNFMSFGHKPKNAGSHIEEVIVNGETQYYEIQTGELGDILNITLNSLGGVQYGKFLGALYAFKNFKTRAITAMPQFKLPNFVRDTMDAFVYRKTNKILNPLAGAKNFITVSDAYKNYMLNGGGYGTLIESTTNTNPVDIFKETKWKKFDRIMSTDEYANRLNSAETSIAEGENWFEAAYRGRDLTVDFSMVGANPVLRHILKLMPFQQAGMNGMYKLIREIKDEGNSPKTYAKAVARLSMKGLTYLTPIAILSFMMNKDDERYKALTADEMARFIWFFYDKNEQPIKIPVPFGLGAIFQKFPEYIMSMLFSDGDFVDNRYSEAVQFAVMHQLLAVPNGGIFDPLIQEMKNEKFTGAPIVSDKNKKLESGYQYNSKTPLIYQELGKAIGWSPVEFEHYTKGALGYIENAITGMTEEFLWDKENWGEMPYSSTKDYVHGAFFKQFYKNKDTARSAWSEEYYEYRTKIDKAYETMNHLYRHVARDKGESYKEYMSNKDKVKLASLKKLTNNIDGMARDVSVMEEAIYFNKDLTAKEKEEKISKLYKDKTKVMKQAYKAINKTIKGE